MIARRMDDLTDQIVLEMLLSACMDSGDRDQNPYNFVRTSTESENFEEHNIQQNKKEN